MAHIEPHKMVQWLRSRWRALLWNGAKVVLGLGLVWIVLMQTTWTQFWLTVQTVSPVWLVLAAAAFYAQIVFLARRYWIPVRQQIRFQDMLTVTVVQTAVGNLVATGVGAIAYVALLKGQHQIRLTTGIGSLLLARFGDAIVLSIVLAVTAVWSWQDLGVWQWVVAVVLLLMLAGLSLVGLVIVLRAAFVNWLGVLVRKLGIARFSFVQRAWAGLDELAMADREAVKQLLWSTLYYSVWVNGLSILLMWCFVRAFDLPLNAVAVCFAIAVTQLMFLVPIHIMGGLGVFDVTMLSLLVQFGVNAATGAAFLVAWRLLFYGLNVLMLAYVPVANWVDLRVR